MNKRFIYDQVAGLKIIRGKDEITLEELALAAEKTQDENES